MNDERAPISQSTAIPPLGSRMVVFVGFGASVWTGSDSHVVFEGDFDVSVGRERLNREAKSGGEKRRAVRPRAPVAGRVLSAGAALWGCGVGVKEDEEFGGDKIGPVLGRTAGARLGFQVTLDEGVK